MDLGKINRVAEDRSVVWAAVVTAFLGTAALLDGALAHLNGRILDACVSVLLAVVLLGLAYGVYRGSRAAAVTVVVIFVLRAIILFLAFGFSAISPVWTLILGAMLWSGMRGVFAQSARAPHASAHPRRPA